MIRIRKKRWINKKKYSCVKGETRVNFQRFNIELIGVVSLATYINGSTKKRCILHFYP